MQLIQQLDDMPALARGGAVAIGNFDGLHLGHAEILSCLVRRARQLGGPAVVFSFDPHPVELLRPDDNLLRLTDLDRKHQLVADLGVDVMVVYPTDLALLRLTAEDFFQQLIVQLLAARAIVEGPNFCFGRDRAGTIQTLEQLCQQSGVELEIVPALEREGDWVSSSRIRTLIADGDVAAANRLLTAPYRLNGVVQSGAGRGASLGFPTANLGQVSTMLPAAGVYAGRGLVGADCWPAAVNIGGNPTFDEPDAKLEVHLVGFEGGLYGEQIQLELLERVRDIEEFESVDALVAQIQSDIQRVCQRVAAGN